VKAVALALLLVAAPAAAEPRRCNVTIVRAPDDVGAVIEQWVRAERSCDITLAIRVVPVPGGYRLNARDGDGRVRERIVPDAQTAGVLVASWIANDQTQDPFAVRNPSPPDPDDESLEPPGESLPMRVADHESEKPARRRWLSAGVLGSTTVGVRAELDAVVVGNWSFGIAASVTRCDHAFANTLTHSDVDASYWRALATIVRTFSVGRINFRPSLGIGALTAYGRVEQWAPVSKTYGVVTTQATAQLALLLGVELTRNWAVHGGPIMTLATTGVERMGGIGGAELLNLEPFPFLYVGLQRRVW